ncbi:MAG: protein kinase [Polyangiaceae bacterium]
MDLTPGTFVTQNVRLLSPLGSGGMGAVWIAEHRSLGTKVAVKFVSGELLAEEPTIGERFAREASLSAQIKSPYVVQIFDHGTMQDGTPYIVMELLEGESLADRLRRERRLSVGLTELVVTQAAKGLSKAHRAGVVHRDIKPDNLFLTWEDDELFLKVLDFGVAKRTNLPKVSKVTGTGMMVGTPEFMSPEQVLSSKSVDPRADLWSLAVVAYNCLTGGVPFTGETIGGLCVAIADGRFTPPRHYRPDLPPTIDAWFQIALQVDPSRRFQSAKDLATAFTAAVAGELPVQGGAVLQSASWSGSGARPGPVSGSPSGAQAASISGAHAASSSGAHGASVSGAHAGSISGAHAGSISGAQAAPGGSWSGETAVPATHGPTFAGTTVTPRRGNRRFAVVGLIGLVGVAVAAGVLLGRSTEEPSSAVAATEDDDGAAAPDAAVEATATTAEPTPTTDAEAQTPDPEPSASASPSASAPVAPKVVPWPRATTSAPATAPPTAPPPSPPPPVAPTSTTKDRGF